MDRIPKIYPGGARVGKEELDAVTTVIETQRLFRYYGPQEGPSMVDAFEASAANRLGVEHVQAVSSACGGLICAFAALGIGPGDEVIVPAFTWVATASAVIGVGAVPIIAEIDESLTLDPEDVVSRITNRTKAIAIVHMRGGSARLKELLKIAKEHRIVVIEDTAQAFGGTYGGKSLGTFGDVGVFSLQFNKIITAGEGGLVVTQNRQLWERVAMVHDVVGGLRNGIPDELAIPGLNFRMGELQGAVANAQMGKLDGILTDMRLRHRMISERIAPHVEERGGHFRFQPDPEGDTGLSLTFFLPTIDEARFAVDALLAEGLPVMNLYRDKVDYHVASDWVSILAKRSWSNSGAPWSNGLPSPEYTRDDWPRTLDILWRSVHLDVSPDLTMSQVDQICEGFKKVLLSGSL